ncbi:MAG: DUF6599 family protein [Planctomycetota bacterium]|jgi:hypothetical protein
MASPAKTSAPAETVIGLIVLLILIGIAVGVYFKQFRYDATIYDVVVAETSAGAGGADDADGVALAELLPDALAPLTPPERFDPSSLSDKINGKADYYLDAGFVGLTAQRFALDDDPQTWLEFFVYDMGEAANALIVFQSQRRSQAEELELTSRSYRSGGALFFAHGRYYVEVVPSSGDATLADAAMTLAGNFVADTAVETAEAMGEAELFPKEGLIPDSITMQKTDVFGFDKFDNVWLARYRIDEVEVTAYISRRQSDEEAEALARDYIDFLAEMGGVRPPRSALAASATEQELFGNRYFVCYLGPFVCGVHECRDPDVARTLTHELLGRIAEVVNE